MIDNVFDIRRSIKIDGLYCMLELLMDPILIVFTGTYVFSLLQALTHMLEILIRHYQNIRRCF